MRRRTSSPAPAAPAAPRPVVVDRAAWQTVLAATGAGLLHPCLAGMDEWVPPQEAASVLDGAWRGLARAGLAEDRRLTDSAQRWASLLTAPAEERYGWFGGGGGVDPPTVVLAAGRGDRALLAVLGADVQLRLLPIEPDGLDQALVASLPDCTVGSGTLRQHFGAGYDASVYDHRGSGIEQLARTPATGLAELYVAWTPPVGTRRAAAHPVRVRDSSRGRFVLRFTREEAIAEPGTDAAIVQQLRSTRRGLDA